MTKRMLIDASHAEETRVVVLDGNRLEEFDLEAATRKPLKGNIYLAKVVRVEPSLQAAFVEYGGNRHGFLAFSEIHPDYYQIPVADRQRLLEMQAEEAREEEEAEEARERAAEARGRRGAAEPAESDDAEAAPLLIDSEYPVVEPADAEEAPSEDRREDHREDYPAETAPTAEATPEARLVTEEADSEPAAEEDSADAAAEDDAANGEDEARAERDRDDDEEEETPPETIGGEGPEEGRERRIPPRFLRHYKIQEVIRRRQIMLVQVVKEERGTKGAALTTYISLAGRFSVLMPNSPRGGGVSRKITSTTDRKRLREVIDELSLPHGMSLIVRTAGAQRPKPEIRRDCEYLLRLWDNIRERTLASAAPALIYEEADLIKRSIRDVYARDVEEIVVDGEDAFREAREFMRMLMPQHTRKIHLHRDGGLYARYQVEAQLDAMHSPTVQLRSGGYIVINQTEALVAIDVNSGRATRDRHIEDTALRTNLEAADEVARQLRLRDLAGLIVIDFIDMESNRHDSMVERRLKEALKQDRARIQVGRISHFGLLEMSRQRLRPSLAETSFVTCPHCAGRGQVRSVESSALSVLRAIEDEGSKRRAAEIVVHVAAQVALYLLNRKRDRLAQIEARYGMAVLFEPDDSLMGPALRIERVRAADPSRVIEAPAALRMDYAPEPEEEVEEIEVEAEAETETEEEATARNARGETAEGEDGRRRRRRRRRRGGRREDGSPQDGQSEGEAEGEEDEASPAEATEPTEGSEEAAAEPAEATEAEPGAEGESREDRDERGRRRRGRRGGRRRREPGEAPLPGEGPQPEAEGEAAAAAAAPEAPPRPPRQPAAPRYQGPTPADPFAGHVDDIFAAMEAAEAAAEAEALRPRQPAPAPVAPAAAEPASPEPAPAVAVSADPVTAPAEEAQPMPTPEAVVAGLPEVAEPPPPPAAAPEPEPTPAPAPVAAAPATAEPAAPEPVQGPVIQPVVVSAETEAPKRRGWWKR